MAKKQGLTPAVTKGNTVATPDAKKAQRLAARAFVAHYLAGKDSEAAAEEANVVYKVRLTARDYIARPDVRLALKNAREADLCGPLALVAVDTLRDLLRDDTPAATRYKTATWILERAGHTSADAELVAGAMRQRQRPVSDMSSDELQAAIADGMAALGQLSQHVAGVMIEAETDELDGLLE